MLLNDILMLPGSETGEYRHLDAPRCSSHNFILHGQEHYLHNSHVVHGQANELDSSRLSNSVVKPFEPEQTDANIAMGKSLYAFFIP